MPDGVRPNVQVIDPEHARVIFVDGQVVGWTGARAQYAWQIMSAPCIGHDQIIYSESTPISEFPQFPYRGDALAELRRYARTYHLEITEQPDASQQFELRYSESLEQEICELQSRCHHIQLASDIDSLLARLSTYETACTQLQKILTDHFVSHNDEWARIQTLLRCCMDAPPRPE